MRVLFLLSVLLVFFVSISAFVFLGVWTYRDARARGLNSVLWTLVVLLVPSFIGLILYLVAGRNQSVGLCPACNAAIQPGVNFCPRCGQALGAGGEAAAPKPIPKSGSSALVAFIVCIALLVVGMLAFAAIGLVAYRSDLSSGIGQNIAVGRVQNQTADQWHMTFYRLNGTHSGRDLHIAQNGKPVTLHVQSALGSGTLALELTQGSHRVSVTLSGSQNVSNVDLTAFQPGAVHMRLIAQNARNGTVDISWK